MVWIKLERSLDYFKKGTWTDVESERNQIQIEDPRISDKPETTNDRDAWHFLLITVCKVVMNKNNYTTNTKQKRKIIRCTSCERELPPSKVQKVASKSKI